MDRNVLDVIERELDDEVRTRFPGGAVRHVALLQYGDDPQIEPRDLWVRVLLDSDGPEDYDRSWKAFADAHQAAIDEFPRYLAEKVHEIMNVEFRFADGTGPGCDRDGPQWGYPTGRRLSDYQEWERGEATFVRAPLGPSGLETLDTLIMAGIAGTRTEAIRWALDRFRDHPAYERLRERVRDADALKDEFSAPDRSPEADGADRDALAALEREIEDEAKIRFPGGAVSRVRLLQIRRRPGSRAGRPVGPGDPRRRRARGLAAVPEGVRRHPRGRDRPVRELPGREALPDQDSGVHLQRPGHPRRPLPPVSRGSRRSYRTTVVRVSARTSSSSPGWDRPAWKRWTR